MSKHLRWIGVLVLTVGVAATVLADTDTGTLNVTANVVNMARITSVGDISFGDYDPTDTTTPSDASGSVTVRATKALGYTIYIGNDRTMSDGSGNNLSYELYSDSARTSAWGSDLAGGESTTSAGNSPLSHTIYGRISAGQDVPAGSFSDTVTITVEWTP